MRLLLLSFLHGLGCSAVLVLVAQPAASVRGQVQGPPGLTAKIEAILEAQRLDQHIPGFAFAVVRDDRVELVIVRGNRDIEHRLPVTADTVFPIGSCTKAFTSMAIGIAQEQHLLTLGDPPRRFLPWFRMADPQADAGVTLRDMLSHRTGLKAYADLAAEPGILTREEYVRAATAAKPTAAFRAKFQYSNAMYSAVGEVLGRAYHSTWEKVIQSQIFGPLGMMSSLTVASDVTRVDDHATGYVYVEETKSWRAVPPPRSLEALAPGGNIASTARDMGRWLRFLIGAGRLGERRMLSEATFRDLTSTHIAIDASKSYALGWATYDWNGEHVVEHNGGSQGISALVSFIPYRHVGFVFLANTSPNFMTTIGNAGKLLWPLLLGRVAPTPAMGMAAGQSTPDTKAPLAILQASPTPSQEPLPSVDAILARMVVAIGGEDILRRHTTLEVHARKSYENQGVTAAQTIRAKAPDKRTDKEVWMAAGREIARIRVYFDGVRGGQETTFGQDTVNDALANEHARRDDDLYPLLDLKRMYKEVRIEGLATLGTEQTYVLVLVPETDPRVMLYVSTSTALILRRETGNESVTFANYRSVDGERIPFHSIITDPLGETTIDVQDARFNPVIDDAVFAAARPSR